MAGKFEITNAPDGSFSFEFKDDEKVYAVSPVLKKRMTAKGA